MNEDEVRTGRGEEGGGCTLPGEKTLSSVERTVQRESCGFDPVEMILLEGSHLEDPNEDPVKRPISTGS